MFILAQGQSCDTCINTRACMAAARTHLNFTLLFDESLIDGKLCELLPNDNATNTIITTDQSCVELSSNLDYSIRCPLCPQAGRDVYHVINNSIFTNLEDCLDSGTTYMHTYIRIYASCMHTAQLLVAIYNRLMQCDMYNYIQL